jgi:WD40 repeat protein
LTLAFHPTGKTLARESSDRTIKIWKGRSNLPLNTYKKSRTECPTLRRLTKCSLTALEGKGRSDSADDSIIITTVLTWIGDEDCPRSNRDIIR